jgi:tRNA A37 N6-isopentenylltransferase MiaA
LEVTYKSISDKSKELDPDKKGIHPNSVKRNKKLYEYYMEHSKTYARKKALEERDRAFKSKSKLKGFDHIKLGRNKSDVRKRYNKLTKTELIERLIDSEEYIAEQNDRWITEQFQKIDYDE